MLRRLAGASLKSAIRSLSVTRSAVLLLALLLAIYFWRELTRDILIIQPFNVPKQYADTGLTGDVMANHVGDAMDEIKRYTIARQKRVGLRFDEPTFSGELPSAIDIEVPGTKLGLNTLLEVTREAFGIHPKQVRGDVVITPGSADAIATITVRVSGLSKPAVARRMTVPVHDPQEIPPLAAEAVLRDVNPFALGVYKYLHHDIGTVAEIGHEMVHESDRLEQARGHDLIGLTYGDRGRLDAAAGEFRQATELAPKLTFAYGNWGVMLDQAGKPEEAIEEYKKAIAIDPRYARGFSSLGLTLYKKGKLAEGDENFQKAIQLDAQDAEIYLDWGGALLVSRQFEKALSKYERASELDPGNANAWIAQGNTLATENKWGEAARKYRKAVETAPRSADPFIEWGTMLLNQGKVGEATAKFRRAVQVDPQRAEAYSGWGDALERLGLTDQAKEMRAKATALSAESTP